MQEANFINNWSSHASEACKLFRFCVTPYPECKPTHVGLRKNQIDKFCKIPRRAMPPRPTFGAVLWQRLCWNTGRAMLPQEPASLQFFDGSGGFAGHSTKKFPRGGAPQTLSRCGFFGRARRLRNPKWPSWIPK